MVEVNVVDAYNDCDMGVEQSDIESRPKRAKTSNGQTSTPDFLALPTTLSPVIAISRNTEMPGSQQTPYYGTTTDSSTDN